MSKPTKKKLCEHGFPTQLSACPVCAGNYTAWAKKERGLTGKFKAIPPPKDERCPECGGDCAGMRCTGPAEVEAERLEYPEES